MTDREAFEAWAKEKGIPFHWDAGAQPVNHTYRAATKRARLK